MRTNPNRDGDSRGEPHLALSMEGVQPCQGGMQTEAVGHWKAVLDRQRAAQGAVIGVVVGHDHGQAVHGPSSDDDDQLVPGPGGTLGSRLSGEGQTDAGGRRPQQEATGEIEGTGHRR